ncbi:hypothetical protein COCVIDRAFT_28064 [Bipolaris victoriae FI3]|uniref:Uncharacterized protein n=1 Tax=Bipolaris victoriae (strain FI3) TaxID=930091 RepID=W7EES0_BIPV3|nr:hypothetical protein COCVIDRAFT_28064 [Bipolaris victoriae FI3]
MQKKRRHGVKPYGFDDAEPNHDHDDAYGWDNDAADGYNKDDEDRNVNIFNPSGSRVNCTDMGEYYASGLPNTYSPPPEDSYGRDEDEWKQRLVDGGFTYSTEPPEEEYLDRDREFGVLYRHQNKLGHVIAADGGFNKASYTYTDHQERPDKDVTDEVRNAEAEGRVVGYVTRDIFDDRERKLGKRYDSPEEETRQGPADDPD